MNILEELKKGNIPNDGDVYRSFLVTNAKLETYNNVVVSISGGSDSDILVDLFERINKDIGSDITYVFFDTGLEYDATKEHIKYLEHKYGIKIEIKKAKIPIPISCKKYGQPFLSKQVSEFIERLQKHDFKWKDKTFEELKKEYPNCKAALKWWCNKWGEESKFNIEYNKGLKEFIIKNPPKFLISPKCCKGTKKDVIKQFLKDNNFDISCIGVRKAEGGARSTAYKNCFTAKKDGVDQYRPIFYYKEHTKRVYEDHFNIIHSRCYTKYGLKRTGCAGCPYNKDFEEELEVMRKYEPKLYKAACYIFKDSYEYTREYIKFKEQFNNKKSSISENKNLDIKKDFRFNWKGNCKPIEENNKTNIVENFRFNFGTNYNITE